MVSPCPLWTGPVRKPTINESARRPKKWALGKGHCRETLQLAINLYMGRGGPTRWMLVDHRRRLGTPPKMQAIGAPEELRRGKCMRGGGGAGLYCGQFGCPPPPPQAEACPRDLEEELNSGKGHVVVHYSASLRAHSTVGAQNSKLRTLACHFAKLGGCKLRVYKA